MWLNMVFHALTFIGSQGRCWKPKPSFFDTSQGPGWILMHWKPCLIHRLFINSLMLTLLSPSTHTAQVTAKWSSGWNLWKFILILFLALKRPRGRAVSAPDFGSRGHGFESSWRLEAWFFPNLNGVSLHRAFHVHHLKWTKYLLQPK